jgi:hypothetical protein
MNAGLALLLGSAAIAGLAVAAASGPARHGHHHHSPAAAGVSAATTEAQLQVLRRALVRYADFEVARREGWKKFGGMQSGEGPLMGEHWLLPKERGGPDYQHGQAIDFARPSNLIYAEIGGKRQLIGVTFNVRLAEGEPVPEGFAGPADRWHVHDFPKAIAATPEGRPLLRWLATSFAPAEFTRPGAGRGRVAMIHVWPTLPNPDGSFADRHRLLPYLKLGLPAAFADGASVRAAKGLHLATARGCADTIDGALWIANAPRATSKRLHAVCAAAAAHVKQGLATGRKTEVNAMAEHGWAMFSAAWQGALTLAQQARIAAITEHGDAGPLAHEQPSPHAHH